jgi:hypothetical protein
MRGMILELKHGTGVGLGPASFVTSFLAYFCGISLRSLVLPIKLIMGVIASDSLHQFVTKNYEHVMDVCRPTMLATKWRESLEYYARYNRTDMSVYYTEGHIIYLRTQLCSEYSSYAIMVLCFCLYLLVSYAQSRKGRRVQYCYSALLQ